MTIEQLKNELLAHLKLQDDTYTFEDLENQLRSDLESESLGLSYDLISAIDYVGNIYISDIHSITSDDYFTQVEYHSKSTKKNIVLDGRFILADNVDEFLESILELIKEREKIEDSLQGKIRCEKTNFTFDEMKADYESVKKQIKEWELGIDRVINNPDDQEALKELEQISHEMMTINL